MVQIGTSPISGATPHFTLQLAQDNLDIIRYLAEQGADKDSLDSEGDTPLIIAAKGDHLQAIQYLVEQGADMEKANSEWQTALI